MVADVLFQQRQHAGQWPTAGRGAKPENFAAASTSSNDLDTFLFVGPPSSFTVEETFMEKS